MLKHLLLKLIFDSLFSGAVLQAGRMRKLLRQAGKPERESNPIELAGSVSNTLSVSAIFRFLG